MVQALSLVHVAVQFINDRFHGLSAFVEAVAAHRFEGPEQRRVYARADTLAEQREIRSGSGA